MSTDNVTSRTRTRERSGPGRSIAPDKLATLNTLTTVLVGKALDGTDVPQGDQPPVRSRRGAFLGANHRSAPRQQENREEPPPLLPRKNSEKRKGVVLGKPSKSGEEVAAGIERLSAYLKARDAAIELFEALKSEPLHDPGLALAIEDELKVAEALADPGEDYDGARDHVATAVQPKLSAALDDAAESAKVRAEAGRVLAEAEADLILLGGMELADTKGLKALVDAGRLAFSTADDRGGYRAVLEALKGHDQAFQLAHEAVAPAQQARTDYQSRRDAALRHLGQARMLPGADSCPPVKGPADTIASAVNRAEKLAEAAKSADDFRAATDALKGTVAELDKALKASDAVAESVTALVEAKSKVAELARFKFIDATIPQGTVDHAQSMLTRAGTVELANAAVAGLSTLDAEMDTARQAAAEAIAAREKFDLAAADASRKVAEVKKLPLAGTFPPLLRAVAKSESLIKDSTGLADSAADATGLGQATERLKAVDTFVEEAPKLSEKAAELTAKLAESGPRAAKLAAMKYPDPKDVLDHLNKARAALDGATSLAEAKLSTGHLDEFNKAYEQFKKDNKDVLEARQKFLDRRKECVDIMAAAGTVRGADREGPVREVLGEMSLKLATADKLLDAATTPAELKDAQGWLDGIGKLKDATTKAAEDVKKADDADRVAMVEYLDMTTAVERARGEVELMPGGAAFYKRLCVLQLEAKGKLVQDGPVTRGYGAALAHLKGYAAIVAEANKAKEISEKLPVPETVNDAVQVVTDKLDKVLRSVAPRAQCDAHAAEIARAQNLGRLDEDAALGALQAISREISAEVVLQEKFKAESKRLALAVGAHLRTLKVEAPKADPVRKLQEDLDDALASISAKDYTTVVDKLMPCDAAGAGLVLNFRGAKADWDRESKDLAKLRGRCGDLMAWPPSSGRAAALMGEMNLADAKAKGFDYQDAAAILVDVRARLADLDGEVAGSGAAVDLRAFGQTLKLANAAVEKARGEALRSLDALSERLKDVRNTRATKMHADFAAADLYWSHFLADPTMLATGEDLPEMVARMKDQLVKSFGDIKVEADGFSAGSKELKELTTSLLVADANQSKGERPERIKALLAQLEAIDGKPAPERPELAAAGNSDVALIELEQRLRARLETNQEKLAALVKETRATVDLLRKDIEKRKVGEVTFKDYYTRALRELDDADGVLTNNADDYELVYETKAGLKDLYAGLKSVISPEKGDTTQDDVKALWGDMSGTLGGTAKGASDSTGVMGDIQRFLGGKWDIIQARMPSTYNLLRAELQDAIKESKQMHPKDAVAMMVPLQAKIKQAYDAAVLQQQIYEKFKLRRDEVKSLYGKVVEETKTKYTGKCEAFAEKMSTRFSEAKLLANDERGGLHAAFKVLDEIETDLLKIRTAPDPRGELKRLDTAAAQEMRVVRDMAKQFEAEYLFLTETLFGQVKAAIEKAKGDATQLDALKSQASGAKKIVGPYLDVISKYPHEYGFANKLPPADKMLQDYGRARALLAELSDSAKRLRDFPSGTDIVLNESLKKVKKDWYEAALAYASGVRDLAAVIVQRADAPPEHAETAGKVAKAIGEAPRRFGAGAFEAPLEVLGDDEADPPARKAAREEALRTVRRVRRDLEADPLIREMNDTANPFRNLNVANSRLLTALRQIEYKVVGRV